MTLVSKEVFPTFPQVFEDFFNTNLSDWGFRNNSLTNTTLPAVNIVESSDRFTVEMAAPGMSKKDFKIELNNEILTISSELEIKNEIEDDDQFTRKEFSYQSFKRTFRLPSTVVDESKIEASYDNGILKVEIPKREEAKTLPPRQIKIK